MGGWIPTHSQPGVRRWLEANTTPRPLYPQKNLVPIVPVAGWVVGLVWIAGKSLPPPEFNTQTFQPVVIHYTDYTTPATIEMSTNLKFAWRGREKKRKSQSGYLTTSQGFEQASPGCKSWAIPLHQPTQIWGFTAVKIRTVVIWLWQHIDL
jgi:hypothetical protein